MLSRSSLAGLITAVEWTLVLDVSLKSTGLLLAAYLAHLLLGRRRALVRSALWNACLVGLLLLPLASLALPRLRVSIPAPAWQGKSGQAQTPAAPVPFPFTADQPARNHSPPARSPYLRSRPPNQAHSSRSPSSSPPSRLHRLGSIRLNPGASDRWSCLSIWQGRPGWRCDSPSRSGRSGGSHTAASPSRTRAGQPPSPVGVRSSASIAPWRSALQLPCPSPSPSDGSGQP